MAKSSQTEMVGTRLSTETARRIRASGIRPSAWLREAVDLRLDRDAAEATTLKRIEQEVKNARQQIGALSAQVGDLQREVGKLHRHALEPQALPDPVLQKLSNLDHILTTALFNLVPTLLNAMEGRLGELVQEKARAERSVLPERFRGPVRERDEL